MIRRGTSASRLAALGLALGPFLLAVAAFVVWAVSSWIGAGDRIRAAESALHRIEARRSQSELYEPLGKSWAEFAASPTSGLMLEANSSAAAKALIGRVEKLMKRFKGGGGVVNIISAKKKKPGLEVIRAEARGVLPETALSSFFEALEGQEPFLFVEALEMSRSATKSATPMIVVRIRLAAFRMTGAQR